MPKLPSGLSVALNASRITKLIVDSRQALDVHHLMAIESLEDIFPYVDVLFLREKTGTVPDPTYAVDSNLIPSELEPYPSGYNILTIRELFETWPEGDASAFVEFLKEERISNHFSTILSEINEAKQDLLSQHSTAGLLAKWWVNDCHPLQGD